jgi:bacteriocin biosynthesis cyclodehydratase domain-containing protein
MRPILRPGTHVLQRGAGELQVGLDPASALVLPDSPAVRESLRLLTSSADLDAYADPATVDLLAGHDQLIDERDLMPLLTQGDLAPHTAAALARVHGTDVSTVRSSRQRFRTTTRTFGHPSGSGLRDRFLSLTGAAGIREATSRRTAPPDCGVLLGVGEPDRDLLDAWTRAGTPYLLVRLTEGRAVLGPFVVPGSTACLRCVDAHCTDADPSWPLLVRQYAASAARDRADGAPEPVDPLMASLALSWAARDLATYVDGKRPSTWSATVTLDPGLTRIETRSWLRHPGCGCSWDRMEL